MAWGNVFPVQLTALRAGSFTKNGRAPSPPTPAIRSRAIEDVQGRSFGAAFLLCSVGAQDDPGSFLHVEIAGPLPYQYGCGPAVRDPADSGERRSQDV